MTWFPFLKPRPRLSKEAFDAYFHRLPARIRVEWVRDGRFIVGVVQAGALKFKTQGIGAQDFINMVNDAVVRMNDVPEEYIEAVRQVRTYNPPVEEQAKLGNNAVTGSTISVRKNEKVLLLG